MTDKPRESSRFLTRQRVTRVIGSRGQAGRLSPGQKSLLFFAVLLLLAALLAWLDPRPTLRHVNLTMLSGSATGNYHATVDRLGAEVARQHGSIRNLPSAGSVQNLQRLIAARPSCELQFALVQDGTVLPDESGLELLGRLPQPESLIILGRDLERLRVPLDLAGLRIGIGPVGSGTEQLMRRLLAHLSDLRLVVSTPTIDQQLDMLVRGELDLGAMVIDERAALVHDAVVRRKLQILDLPDAVGAGGPAAVRQDRGHRGRADRLCAPAAAPGHARAAGGHADRRQRLREERCHGGPALGRVGGLPDLRAAQQGPAQPDRPAAVPSRGQLLARRRAGRPGHLCALGGGHPAAADLDPARAWRCRCCSAAWRSATASHLWRIDAQRVRIEREIPALFHAGVTLGEIAEMRPGPGPQSAETRAVLDSLLARLDALAERCRRKSLSILVPMGEEMSYRYQETLIAELQYVLRQYRERLPSATSTSVRRHCRRRGSRS